jgi:hypothetical protein
VSAVLPGLLCCACLWLVLTQPEPASMSERGAAS